MKKSLAEVKDEMELGNVGSIPGLKKVSKQQVETLKEHQKTIQNLMKRIKQINQQFKKLQNYQNTLRKNIQSLKRVNSVIQEQKELKAKTAGIGEDVKQIKKSDAQIKNRLKKIKKWDAKLWKRVQNIKTFLQGTNLVCILFGVFIHFVNKLTYFLLAIKADN